MDLANQEKRSMRTMWVNVYRGDGKLVLGTLFDSLNAALTYGSIPDYLCTCPIEIPDLEGE